MCNLICCRLLHIAAHTHTHTHSYSYAMGKNGIASNVPGCERVCVDGVRQMEHGFYFRKEIASGREKEREREGAYHVILNHHVLSPQYCRIFCGMFNIHPNAICCNLVILHGRLFPINASHTVNAHANSSFTLCVRLSMTLEKKSVDRCFHHRHRSRRTQKDVYIFFSFVPVFTVFVPNAFTSICCAHNPNK